MKLRVFFFFIASGFNCLLPNISFASEWYDSILKQGSAALSNYSSFEHAILDRWSFECQSLALSNRDLKKSKKVADFKRNIFDAFNRVTEINSQISLFAAGVLSESTIHFSCGDVSVLDRKDYIEGVKTGAVAYYDSVQKRWEIRIPYDFKSLFGVQSASQTFDTERERTITEEAVFHEILHVARVDNQTARAHNDIGVHGGGALDSVFACAQAALPPISLDPFEILSGRAKLSYVIPYEVRLLECETCYLAKPREMGWFERLRGKLMDDGTPLVSTRATEEEKTQAIEKCKKLTPAQYQSEAKGPIAQPKAPCRRHLDSY